MLAKRKQNKRESKEPTKKPLHLKIFFFKAQAILQKNPHNEVPSNSDGEPPTNFLENYVQQAL